MEMKGQGFYEISGIAYSGAGRITKVMVSADGGKSWAEAALQEPVMSKSFTRFRAPWQWNGGPAILQSRAWDDQGNVQPTRAEIIAQKCMHCHGEGAKGGVNAALVGAPPIKSIDATKTIANFWPYSTTVFDFIRRAMPWQQPRSLTDDEVYALTAYILVQNKLIG